VKPWTVARTWWELTKLVLARRGGYDLYLRVDDLSDDAQGEFNGANWAAYHLDWVGGGDRFAILSAEPEDGRTVVREAPSDRVADLEAKLAKERMLSAGLTSDVGQLTGQVIALRLKLDIAEGEAARLRTDHAYVQAERCECGGDAELHWRTRALAAEQQGARDRANAVRLTEQLAHMRERVAEADRVVHIAEQLRRDGSVSA
jgi:hypothetical protein